ncbi:MAG: hypothetical protein PSY12_06465 [bacterium]|nr:hypothetical protein [bacterium]
MAAETGSKPVMNQAQAFDRHIRRLEAGRSIFTALRTGRLNRLKLADIFNMHGLLIFVSSLPRIKKWTGREMRNGFRP